MFLVCAEPCLLLLIFVVFISRKTRRWKYKATKHHLLCSHTKRCVPGESLAVWTGTVPPHCFTAMLCSALTAANEILRSHHSHHSTFFSSTTHPTWASGVKQHKGNTSRHIIFKKRKRPEGLLQLRGLQWSRDLSADTSIPSLGSSNCKWLLLHNTAPGPGDLFLLTVIRRVTQPGLCRAAAPTWLRDTFSEQEVALLMPGWQAAHSQTLLALPFFPALSQILFLPLM